MSIRWKILLGCLNMACVTILLGFLSRNAEIHLGATAAEIYDQAFMSMSYLRSAQNVLLSVSRDLVLPSKPAPDLKKPIAVAVEDLDIAAERAMSPAGRLQIARLRPKLMALGQMASSASMQDLNAQVRDIEADFDMAVEVYAGDGYRNRHAIDLLVQRTAQHTWMAMGASLLAALAITILLSRAIVPWMQRAVSIAAAIAAGKLDNDIPRCRRGETGTLFSALGTMQDSIASNLARIQALMEDQSSSHARETFEQHAMFEAALNNITQGLCMFNSNGLLLVYNRRFAEMFGEPQIGTTDAEALPPALNASQFSSGGAVPLGAVSFTHALDDGRIIAVNHRPRSGGGWVVTYEDISERRRAEADLAHLIRHDALTNLPNRMVFSEELDRSLGEPQPGAGLAILVLDIDDFKTTNDMFGHPVGDALLLAVAERLRDGTRDCDIVARLGANEFAIMQVGAVDVDETIALAERLLAVLREPFVLQGQVISIEASMGIVITSDMQVGASELINNADLALSQAKAEGRGTYRVFQEEMNARMQSRRVMTKDLRRALEEEQFEVHYQPLISMPQGEVCGFEALVRWRHPERGLVSPGDFIPLAEELGLIEGIGAWVLNQACHDALNWPSTVKVAVNLSPVQFRNGALATQIAAALERSGLAPSRLDVEITESVLLQDSSAVLVILQEIKALGVNISMDDFGTGYSSLSYLQKFPFNKIKIDQSFVRTLADGQDCSAIVRAVIQLGRSLGMSVLAEGVETQAQLEFLRREGCGEVQGYLFSPPRPVASVLPIIQRFSGVVVP